MLLNRTNSYITLTLPNLTLHSQILSNIHEIFQNI